MRGPQPQQVMNSQLQLSNNQPQQFNSVSQTQGIQQRLGGQQSQHMCGPPQQQMRGPSPQLVAGTRQQFGDVCPQQRFPPQNQIMAPQQARAQPPQQIGGPRLQQTVRNQAPPQLRGPSPQLTRPPASLQYNPVQHQLAQIRGPPPGAQLQTQHAPPAIKFQAPPPAIQSQSSFIPSQHFPQQQQHVGFNTGVNPDASVFQVGNTIQQQVAPAQQHLYSMPPPQVPQSSSMYTPGIPPATNEFSQSHNSQAPSSYQQSYQPAQPEYQQQESLYSNPYPSASGTQVHPSVASSYQYNQANPQPYTGSYYDNEQAAPQYQNTSQQHYSSQQGLASTSHSQDSSYPASSDYYTPSQSIQTIQTVSNE
ncbi:hypothetical protein EGW08_014419, partial [Elysia chlorotica]